MIALKLAGSFLLPAGDGDAAEDTLWRTAGRWLVVWGLLFGIVYATVFRVAWKLFGEYQYIRFVPAACVLAADLAFGGYRLLWGATRIVGGRDASRDGSSAPLALPGVLTVVLIAILKYALLLSIPVGVTQAASSQWSTWHARLGVLYPQAIYRPLILMPLWGRWAMMLAMSIGRTSPDASTRLRQMAAGVRLPLIMVYWLLCALLTVLYGGGSVGYLARGVVIGLGVMVVSYLVSFVLARQSDGQNEATVGAAGLAGEITFLCLYLSVASRIYWY